MSSIQHCVVTAAMLRTYKQPKIDGHPISTLPKGTPLSFTLVKGQKLPLNHPQNDNWGFNAEGRFYFWLGDTSYNNGHLSPLPDDISPVNSGTF